MRTLAAIVLWVAIVVFTLVGLSGVLFGAWEFTLIVPVDLDSVTGDRTTLMNQMRFLKALELAAGIVLFALRRDFFERAHVNRAVVAMLWVTPLARVVSMTVDGMPDPSFVALLGVELLGAITVLAYSVRRFGAPWAEPTSGATARL